MKAIDNFEGIEASQDLVSLIQLGRSYADVV